MEQITKVLVYPEAKSIYEICKDFMEIYPETGRKIFDTIRSQLSEGAFKFNNVNSIIEVVYRIKWGETEEGFMWWDEFYTHLNKLPKE